MKAFKEEEHDEIMKKGQHVSPNVYFMKQLVGNACGTVGVVHCLANNAKALGLRMLMLSPSAPSYPSPFTYICSH